MSHLSTYEALKAGELKEIKELRLNNLGIEVFPEEIFSLFDSLELLDLSGNKLSDLPQDLYRFKHLKIAFLSSNQFKVFPEVLAQCPSLKMIGFKNNQIEYIPEDAFPAKLRWLILTQNRIEHLPKSIGKHIRLQKLMLAGNLLQSLPDELQNCSNLELLRISANNFHSLPTWLWQMPKLAWLAYAANPCSAFDRAKVKEIKFFDWHQFEILEKIGEGASGLIYKAYHTIQKKELAIKIFKGEMTSDGFPESEMDACIHIESHQNLVKVLGKLENHPENRKGLVMELLPVGYSNLGLPPTFESCTRDVFLMDFKLSFTQISKIVLQMTLVANHLHENNFLHGDLYAHNTLIDREMKVVFGDFGAATPFHKFEIEHQQIEVRALGYFVDDLLKIGFSETPIENKIESLLIEIRNSCLSEIPLNRPSFHNVIQLLIRESV